MSAAVRPAGAAENAGAKVIIAHRGASGYLPEHTLEAKAMAHAFGADFLEQDLVLTKDGVPVVLHDITLEAVTDVEDRFPGRNRPDGKFYAIDFTLAEIKTLNVHERVDTKTGKPAFRSRFPQGLGQFRIPTFEEELQMIQGMNASRGMSAGIYPELKSPAFHHAEGKDLAAAVLPILKKYGYWGKATPCFLQCFEWPEVERVRKLGYPGQLVFLMGKTEVRMSESGDAVPLDASALKRIAEVADGIGPALGMVVDLKSPTLAPTGLIDKAHAAGLVVHPYTIRVDVPVDASRPDGAILFDAVLGKAGADGVFTDHPDRGVAWKRGR
ncbi:glycerophosphodiester phosphodiesterase [bacterium]|nr:glycerophosphodiester phosphodiesterase [bacterium]